jgi:hypothetical protein
VRQHLHELSESLKLKLETSVIDQANLPPAQLFPHTRKLKRLAPPRRSSPPRRHFVCRLQKRAG